VIHTKYYSEICIQAFGRKEGKRPLGRYRCRWEGNIKMSLQKVGEGDMDWIDLAQDRERWWVLVNAVMKLQVL
jgi:hypothetical protein